MNIVVVIDIIPGWVWADELWRDLVDVDHAVGGVADEDVDEAPGNRHSGLVIERINWMCCVIWIVQKQF